MKTYRVARSIYGDLGSLRRNEVLTGDDPRIVNNPKAVKALLASKMLIEGDADDAPKSKPQPEKAPAKGKARAGGDD